MHKATVQIQKIIEGLNPNSRAIVTKELLETLGTDNSMVAEEAHQANTNIPPEAILQLLKDKCNLKDGEDADTLHFDPYSCPYIDKIGQGLKRVAFDFENSEYQTGARVGRYDNLIGPRRFGKIPAVGCAAGGDWEYPVFFIIYIDQDGQTLRAYVPKDGNVWNYDNNQAFGDADNGGSFLERWAVENLPNIDKMTLAKIGINPTAHAEIMFNEERLLKDIEDNIKIA